MQLRKSVTIPTRFEDEEPISPLSRNGTKPAHPGLLRAQVVAFNPDCPPAAFPSLPLNSTATPVTSMDEPDIATSNDSETLNSLPADGLRISLGTEEDKGEQQQTDNADLRGRPDTSQNDDIEQEEAVEGLSARETASPNSTIAAELANTASKVPGAVFVRPRHC